MKITLDTQETLLLKTWLGLDDSSLIRRRMIGIEIQAILDSLKEKLRGSYTESRFNRVSSFCAQEQLTKYFSGSGASGPHTLFGHLTDIGAQYYDRLMKDIPIDETEKGTSIIVIHGPTTIGDGSPIVTGGTVGDITVNKQRHQFDSSDVNDLIKIKNVLITNNTFTSIPQEFEKKWLS